MATCPSKIEKKNIQLLYLLKLLCIALAVHNNFLFSTGSNNAVTRQALSIFNTSGNISNIMLGFSAFYNGFRLQSRRTTCSWDCFFPVSGPATITGGKLFLMQDIIFNNNISLTTDGIIVGRNHRVIFSPRSDFVLSNSLTFSSSTVIFNAHTNLHGKISFNDPCKVDCNSKILTLMGNAELILRNSGPLVIENMDIVGLKKNNIRCLNNTGAITFRNCRLCLSQDFTFSNGSILFDQSVLITGTNKFNYTTTLGSTIKSFGYLYLDQGITFSYAPNRPNKNLIFMSDKTSTLYLNGSTLHSTRTGIRLSNGTVIIDNKVTFTSEASNTGQAIILDSSLNVQLMGSAFLDTYGHIVYN